MPGRSTAPSLRPRPEAPKTRIVVEELELRDLPSGTPALVAVPALGFAPQATAVATPGLSPSQMRRAYGVDQVTFGGVVGDGAGQTIAIVTAYDHPGILADLRTFDRTFGLPDPPFVKLWSQGQPSVDPVWALETALDVEWAHAIAPAASLLLIEAPSSDSSDLVAAVDFARRQPGVSVVSMSWGLPEFAGQGVYDGVFTTPAGREAGAGVSFVAASGDAGAAQGPLWPSVSPNVLAVGGTQIRVEVSGDYVSEAGWSGSGGGTSRYAAAPASQSALTGDARRSTPDVAYNASDPSGVSVYSSVGWNGRSGWFRVAGTSAGAPQWAGLLALANQGRARSGKPALDGALPSVYALPASAFHDIVGGGNGYVAGPGYDLVTGRGTPFADRVVAGLVGATGAVTLPPRSAAPPPISAVAPAPVSAPPPPPAPPSNPTPPAPPAPAPSSTKLNLGSLAARLGEFYRRTTGKGLAQTRGTTALALRLPPAAAPLLEATAGVQ